MDNRFTQNTDAMTGNHPDDHDYAYCHDHGIPTLESQRRRAAWGHPASKPRIPNNVYPFAGGGMASSCGD